MLLQMRNLTRGWVVRIFLFLVAATMAVTLVQGDFLNLIMGGFQPSGVARVGSDTISPQQLTRELDLFLRQQRRQGTNVTRAEAVEAGVHTRLLESLIGRRALHALAHDLGVSASNHQVAEALRQIPSLQSGLSGGFDAQTYAAFLNEVGYTQPEFEREMRGDISAGMVMQSLVSGVRAPASFGALVLAFETEQRTVSVVEVPGTAIGRVDPPNEAQLLAFYEDNAEALQVPEYRAVTMVLARPADFAARVDVPEARLREDYEARRASLATPETRTFVQISAQTEAQARDAAARLARGETAEAVAQALSLPMVRYDQQPQTSVPDSAVGTAVFALAENAPPTAVRGRLSPWAAVDLQGVTRGEAPTFEALRNELHDAIAAEEGGVAMNEAMEAFDDARSAGTPIGEAARNAGLVVVTIPSIDAQGNDPQGQPVEALAGQEDLVETVFDTLEGEASDFLPVQDAYVILSVDRVIPQSTRPLEEVSTELSELWVARERARRLQEFGDEFAAAVAGGQSFDAAVRARRLRMVADSQPIDRRTATQLPARRLGGQIFSAREGQVVSDIRADGGALYIAIVEGITRADPAEAPELVEQARLRMEQELTEALSESITAEAISRANVRRNEDVINRTFGITETGAGEEEEAPAAP